MDVVIQTHKLIYSRSQYSESTTPKLNRISDRHNHNEIPLKQKKSKNNTFTQFPGKFAFTTGYINGIHHIY